MSNKLEYFTKLNKAHPDEAVLKGTLIYEVIAGSRAYGCNRPDSDYDIYGICIPPLATVFPHLGGVIHGFSVNPYEFSHYEQADIFNEAGEQYSFSIFNIVRAFDLLLGCNPNIIEILFCPHVNVTHITKAGLLIRDNRKLFLSKLYINKMRAYASSQMKRARNFDPKGKRKDLVEKFGFDTKSAQNLIRLTYQAEQVLLEKDLDLQRNAKTLLDIRNGLWSLEKIEELFNSKHAEIEKLVLTSDLQAKPDESKIKSLLLECLEIQYGKISKEIVVNSEDAGLLKTIHEMTAKYAGDKHVSS